MKERGKEGGKKKKKRRREEKKRWGKQKGQR